MIAFQRVVVIHEIGHQFARVHSAPFPDHVMAVPSNEQEEGQAYDQVPRFGDGDILGIRRHVFGIWP